MYVYFVMFEHKRKKARQKVCTSATAFSKKNAPSTRTIQSSSSWLQYIIKIKKVIRYKSNKRNKNEKRHKMYAKNFAIDIFMIKLNERITRDFDLSELEYVM